MSIVIGRRLHKSGNILSQLSECDISRHILYNSCSPYRSYLLLLLNVTFKNLAVVQFRQSVFTIQQKLLIVENRNVTTSPSFRNEPILSYLFAEMQ